MHMFFVLVLTKLFQLLTNKNLLFPQSQLRTIQSKSLLHYSHYRHTRKHNIRKGPSRYVATRSTDGICIGYVHIKGWFYLRDISVNEAPFTMF